MFSSFSSHFAFGKSPVVQGGDPHISLITPGTTSPVYGSGAATWTSTTNNALVNDGYTLLISNNADDANSGFSIPFTFYIYGVAGTSLYPGSNTYITLNSGSSAYGGLSLNIVSPYTTPIPNIAGIHIGSGDNSWQRVWYKTSSTVAIIRYEGNGTTGGVGGSPGIVYETAFYKSNGTNQYISIKIGTHTRTTGVFGITDGVGTSFLSFGTLFQNTNYVVKTDVNGNNPQIFVATYTP